MTKSLYELTGLPANTPKPELASAIESRMNKAFSRAAAGDERAQKELAELRFSYLVWAYGADEHAGAPPPSGECPPRQDAVRRGGERRYRLRRQSEPTAVAGQRCLSDRRCSERRVSDYGFSLLRPVASAAHGPRKLM